METPKGPRAWKAKREVTLGTENQKKAVRRAEILTGSDSGIPNYLVTFFIIQGQRNVARGVVEIIHYI